MLGMDCKSLTEEKPGCKTRTWRKHMLVYNSSKLLLGRLFAVLSSE